MIYNNKIEAIKAVRGEFSAPEITWNYSTQVHEISTKLGLLAAKTMVEAIMELGVRNYLEKSLRDLNSLSVKF